MAGETVEDKIDKAILEAGTKFVRDDTLLLRGGNDEVLKIITGIMAATGGKGILVYDRGISHERSSPRRGALARVRQTRFLRGFHR